MSENNSNLDDLLAAAHGAEQMAEQKRQQEAKEKDQQVTKLISDLEMRWYQTADHGMTEALINTPEEFENKENQLRDALHKKVQEIEEKQAEVDSVLASENVSEELRADIEKAFGEEKKAMEQERDDMEKVLQEHSAGHMDVRKNYKEAKDFKHSFQRKFNSYDSKVDGKQILQILLTKGDKDKQAQWFYENLLTADEQKMVDELREEGWESVALKNHVFDGAKKMVRDQVSEKISKALKDSFIFNKETKESKKLSEEIDGIERDLKDIDGSKNEFKERLNHEEFNNSNWRELGAEIEEKLKEYKDDLEAHRQGKKGFGRNTSENRKARLQEVGTALREKLNTKYSKADQLTYDMKAFSYDLYEKKHLLESDGTLLNTVDKWDDMPQEIRSLAEKLFPADVTAKQREERVWELMHESFADLNKESDEYKKLKKMHQSLGHRRLETLQKIKEMIDEKRDEISQRKNKLESMLRDFPKE